jgi:hypothetical protein
VRQLRGGPLRRLWGKHLPDVRRRPIHGRDGPDELHGLPNGFVRVGPCNLELRRLPRGPLPECDRRDELYELPCGHVRGGVRRSRIVELPELRFGRLLTNHRVHVRRMRHGQVPVEHREHGLYPVHRRSLRGWIGQRRVCELRGGQVRFVGGARGLLELRNGHLRCELRVDRLYRVRRGHLPERGWLVELHRVRLLDSGRDKV